MQEFAPSNLKLC